MDVFPLDDTPDVMSQLLTGYTRNEIVDQAERWIDSCPQGWLRQS